MQFCCRSVSWALTIGLIISAAVCTKIRGQSSKKSTVAASVDSFGSLNSILLLHLQISDGSRAAERNWKRIKVNSAQRHGSFESFLSREKFTEVNKHGRAERQVHYNPPQPIQFV